MTDALCKNKILFVPGKNPKPPAEDHRALLWRSLQRGLNLIDPAGARVIAAMADCFQLIAWNDVYYGQAKDLDDDLPWIEVLFQKTGPDAADLREALSWRNKRAHFYYLLADYFRALLPLLPDPVVKSTIRETERYFRNQGEIGSQVRELLKAPLRRLLAEGHRVLVIGHSLGSVIAYDALWEMTHVEKYPGKVDLFLSLGSPLGMNYVQDRLLGYRERRFPCNFRRWVNIAAHGDITALDPVIHDDFLPMIKQGCVEAIEDQTRPVFTYFRNEKGLNVHRSYGYLVEQHVARTILSWWRGSPDHGCGPPQSPALAVRPGMA